MHAASVTEGDINERRTSDKFNFSTGVNRGAEILDNEMRQLIERDGYADCYDDVSGERLEESGVREARALEMEFFQKMRVYDYVTRSEATRSGKGKIIKGRWIDVNKGDSQNPDYRSRSSGRSSTRGLAPACMPRLLR